MAADVGSGMHGRGSEGHGRCTRGEAREQPQSHRQESRLRGRVAPGARMRQDRCRIAMGVLELRL